MTKKQERLTYVFMIMIMIALGGYLAWDVTHANRGLDIQWQPEQLANAADGDDPDAVEAGNIFKQRDLLFPIVTPEPTPTRVILPTPTPTPLPFAQKWRLKAILGGWVTFEDNTGKSIFKQKGAIHKDCEIVELNTQENYMLIKFLGDDLGRTKKIGPNGPRE
jgi:hypothetical protein